MTDDARKTYLAVFGEKPNHEDGLFGIVSAHAITLYGTKDNPGGIAKDVRVIKRWVTVGSLIVSVCGVLLVVMEFFTKISPLLRALSQ